MPRRNHHHHGYTLLLTLVVLLLAAGVMTGACRYSLRQTLAASRAEEELQRRWGELSCRSVFLSNADRILSRAEANSGNPVASLTRQFMLGRQSFTVVLADEQAKVNINTLYTVRGNSDAAKTESLIRALLQPHGVTAELGLKPSPVPRQPDQTTDAPRTFASLGQVFFAEPADKLMIASGIVTCWGDGKLNFRRAGEAALKHLCSPIIDAGDARRLHALGHSAAPLTDALQQLHVLTSRQPALRDLLTDDSYCQSLWIIVGTSQRNWYYLSVDDASPGGGGKIHFEF